MWYLQETTRVILDDKDIVGEAKQETINVCRQQKKVGPNINTRQNSINVHTQNKPR
jgi:hypothetical protein